MLPPRPPRPHFLEQTRNFLVSGVAFGYSVENSLDGFFLAPCDVASIGLKGSDCALDGGSGLGYGLPVLCV